MERGLREKLADGRFNGVSPARSRAMSAIRSKDNTTTERRLRLALVRARIRGWQLNPRHIPGKPDFFFANAKIAIFTDGCFWHGCPMCGHLPLKNSAFWKAKISRNRERDRDKTLQLQSAGYQVLRFWEHELKSRLETCIETIRDSLKRAS